MSTEVLPIQNISRKRLEPTIAEIGTETAAADAAAIAVSKVALSYMSNLTRVVELMLHLHTKMAERERLQKEDQKIKYTKANEEWGKHQIKLGNIGWYSSAASVGFMVLPYLVRIPQADKPFVDLLADKVPQNIGSMASSDIQSKQRTVDGVSAVTMNEMNALANKGSSDSGKQEVTQILTNAQQALKDAARAG